MNIEGAIKVSASSAIASVDRAAQIEGDAGSMPEGFADALLEQIKLISAAKGLKAVPQSLQDLATAENFNRLHSIAGLLGNNKGATQELAALFGKDLPMNYKINDSEDIEATLSTLTEALQQVLPEGYTEQPVQRSPEQLEVAAEVLIHETLAANPVTIKVISDYPVEQDAHAKPEHAVRASSPLVPENQAENSGVSAETMEISKEMLAVFVMPGQEANKNTADAAKNISDVATKAKAPLMPGSRSPETVHLNNSEQVASYDDSPQQRGPLGLIVQQDHEESAFKKIDLTEKIEQTVQLPGIESEKSLPRLTADIAQQYKQISGSRVDVPVMTRPVGHPDWNNDLGERILWMHSKSMPMAEIKLNPQHLGPISVRVDMNQDQATIAFTSPHAAVREALEASVPRLREMMHAQQINLTDVGVFQNSSEQRQAQSQHQGRSANDWSQGAGRMIDDATVDVEALPSNEARVTKGLLSIYA